MNAPLLLFLSIIFLAAGYRFYGGFLLKKFDVSDDNITPANSPSCKDNCDFVAAKNPLILFGHHFSSIAGAGPILGPIIAAIAFGWKGTLAWILIGSVFLGGVSDFGALILSIRSGGKSISDSSGTLISASARKFFIIFVILALILVNAIFTLYAAKTLYQSPDISLTAMGLIPVAIIFGWLVYRKNFNVTGATIGALVIFVLLVIYSNKFPIQYSVKTWTVVLLAYAFFASVLPVNFLLQPRDYLSGFLLYSGIAAAAAGILVFNTSLKVSDGSTLLSAPHIWPILFITVACGAISGFHTLIASGTTSKQIARETHALPIGYGAMLVEGLLAVIALITVSAAISGNTDAAALAANPIAIFAAGFGKITSAFMGGDVHGAAFAILILNSFILTTLDTSVRITRYLIEELVGKFNKYIISLIVVIVSGLLALSGEGEKIWPVFGASNQLVAALALMVITMWLVSKNKKHIFTLLPALFMFVTTLAGLIIKAKDFWGEKKPILAIIPILLSALAIYAATEFARVYFSSITKKKGAV